MARVLGESGRYLSQETANARIRIWYATIAFIGLVGIIEGFLLCLLVFRWGSPLLGVASLLILCAFWFIQRHFRARLEALEKERIAKLRGMVGEVAVGAILEGLPVEFCVINDLKTPFGNLDHVVVGRTGVFILETKNWRGVVSADGKGELLHNSRPTDKPTVRQFVGRMLGVRDKVKTLVPDVDPYYEAVFVFPSARVDAKWGTTGKVNCIRDDQLFDYIVEKDFGKGLKPDEVERIAQAFLGLAVMEKEFPAGEQSKQPSH